MLVLYTTLKIRSAFVNKYKSMDTNTPRNIKYVSANCFLYK